MDTTFFTLTDALSLVEEREQISVLSISRRPILRPVFNPTKRFYVCIEFDFLYLCFTLASTILLYSFLTRIFIPNSKRLWRFLRKQRVSRVQEDSNDLKKPLLSNKV